MSMPVYEAEVLVAPGTPVEAGELVVRYES